MMPQVPAGSRVQLLLDSISKSLAAVFSKEFASEWSVEVAEGDAPPQDRRLCFGLALSGDMQGRTVIQIRESDVAALAQRLHPQSEKPEPELQNDSLEAVKNLMQQVVASVTSRLREKLAAVEVQMDRMDAPPNWPGPAVILKASAVNVATLVLEVRMDEALLTNLSAAASSDVASTAQAEKSSSNRTSNLNLLLGVKLNLTLRFGQRLLTLRELLDLGPGSVIELDRQAQDPLDVLLGEKLLARGEAIIVDGNYGVRVTEVIDNRQTTSGRA